MSRIPPFRIALSALFLLLSSPLNALSAEVKDHLLSGSKFVQEKKYKDAIREFETAVKLAPDDPEANHLLGMALAKDGDLEGAEPYSMKSAQLKPSYAAYYILGLIYSNQGRHGSAVQAYEQALQLNPKSYQAWHQLGMVHSTTLAFDKAVEAYKKAAELNPKFPDAYQGLGSAYYWTGNLSASLKQVDALNKLGFTADAKELENWIKNKEAKRKKSGKKAPKPAV